MQWLGRRVRAGRDRITDARTLRDIQTRLAKKSPFVVSTIVDGPDVGDATVVDASPQDVASRVTHEGPNVIFTELFEPPPALIVCGAGDDARSLVTYASEAGFAVTMVDHRQAFLNANRFPLAERLVCRRPEAGADELGVDSRTLVMAPALFEEISYDEAGNIQGDSFMDYLLPTAMETPRWETDKTVTPSPHHPLGAKGVGESATVGAPPAIVNAVVDALAHLGVRHIDIPITPEKVWNILREKGVAE
jgi:hypothetical protein